LQVARTRVTELTGELRAADDAGAASTAAAAQLTERVAELEGACGQLAAELAAANNATCDQAARALAADGSVAELQVSAQTCLQATSHHRVNTAAVDIQQTVHRGRQKLRSL